MGPFIGGFASMNKGWRWTQWPILFIAVPSYIFAMGASETYKKIILQKRSKKLNIPPPPKMTPSGIAGIRFLLTVTLFRPLSMLGTEPIVLAFSSYTALNFAILFGFFDAFPIVFEGIYGFNSGEAGLTFLAIGLGCIFGVITVIITDRLTYRKEHHTSHREGRGGVVAPEHRLYPAMLGSLGLPIGLFWFAWTSRRDVHWISPVLAAIPFAWGNLCVFCSAALYLVDVYGPLNGASALAANGLLRYIGGAVFPLFTIQSKYSLHSP